MAVSREQSIEQVIAVGKLVFRAMQLHAEPHWRELDLTMSQLKALVALATHGPTTIGQLGQRLGIQLPGASHVADALVQLELADRYEDPEDRRRTYVCLTARGHALVEHLREGGRERARAWLAELDDDDLLCLLNGLQAMAAVVTRR